MPEGTAEGTVAVIEYTYRAVGGRIGNSSFVGCHKGNREGHIGPGGGPGKNLEKCEIPVKLCFQVGFGGKYVSQNLS